MATIPNPALERRTTPTPGTRIARADVGQVGSGLQSIGQGMGDLADDAFAIQVAEKQRIDGLRVDDAFTQYRQHLLDLQVGENGYQRVKGDGVLKDKFTERYSGMATSKIDEIASTLGNEQQAELFKQKAKNASLAFKSDLIGHAMQEEGNAAKASYLGKIDIAQKEAYANFDKPDRLKASRGQIVEATRDYYDKYVGSPEAKEAAVIEANSDFNSGIIRAMIAAEKFDDADTLLNNKDFLKTIKDADTVSTLKKDIELARNRKDREMNELLEKEREETENNFFTAFRDGELTWDAIEKSNLEIERKEHWASLIDKQAKGDTSAYKTNTDVENALWLAIQKEGEKFDTDAINWALANKQITREDADVLQGDYRRRVGKDIDPLKSDAAAAAIQSINYARTAKLFSRNTKENNSMWMKRISQIKQYIRNNYDKDGYDPAGTAELMVEKAKKGTLRKYFGGLTVGNYQLVDEYQSEKDFEAEIESLVNGLVPESEKKAAAEKKPQGGDGQQEEYAYKAKNKKTGEVKGAKIDPKTGAVTWHTIINPQSK